MSNFIRGALTGRGLIDAYHSRPPYQQNDTVAWITRAKQESTKQKRLNQILDELEGGKMYMSMAFTKDHSFFCGDLSQNLDFIIFTLATLD